MASLSRQEEVTNATKNRFFSKIKKEDSGCWTWLGANNGRYGSMTINRKTNGAHRISFLIHKGDIPDGLFVLHSCDNTWCVNPDHLLLGDHAQNMKDKSERGRYWGDRVNTSKLTAPAVRLARRAYRDGHYTQAELAEILGISQPAVSSLIRESNWRKLS